MSLCSFCRTNPMRDRHHPTARGTDGAYLDPGFIIGVCHGCNCAEDHAQRIAGLDRIVDPSLARLRRSAFTLAKLGNVGSALSPESCTGLAWSLRAVIDDLTARGRT